MCGFAGFYGGELENRRETAESMSAEIAHRGPDDSGVFADETAALGFRRLSIIDLGGGAQPMRSQDGRFVIVFNGEIYNYRELRAELDGHAARDLAHGGEQRQRVVPSNDGLIGDACDLVL